RYAHGPGGFPQDRGLQPPPPVLEKLREAPHVRVAAAPRLQAGVEDRAGLLAVAEGLVDADVQVEGPPAHEQQLERLRRALDVAAPETRVVEERGRAAVG